MLEALFTSDFFKDESVRYQKVKNPAEMVVSLLRMVGEHQEIKPGLFELSQEPKYMGMDLMNPPTVEGWHTGREWIDSGTLVERINFAAEWLGNTETPGVQGSGLPPDGPRRGPDSRAVRRRLPGPDRPGAGHRRHPRPVDGPRQPRKATSATAPTRARHLHPPHRRDVPDDRLHRRVPVRVNIGSPLGTLPYAGGGNSGGGKPGQRPRTEIQITTL